MLIKKMTTMKMNNQNGAALLMSLFFVVVLIGIQAAFVFNVVHESQMARIEREQTKTFYASQGGIQAALEELNELINTDLKNTIASASPSGVINTAKSKVSSSDGIGWLVYAVRNNNVAQLSQNGEEALYTATGTIDGNTYNYNIIFAENGDPHLMTGSGQCPGYSGTSANAWEFPYIFRIESTATSGSISSKLVTNGDFTVCLQPDNFAKFALFTNRQQMPSGTNVWFTDKTNFNGPVHTNDRFNFAFNPSGTFDDLITQYQQTARFYNNNNPLLLNANNNGNTDVPVFNNGFNRNISQITFNSGTTEADMITQVKGSNTYGSNGIYLPNSSNSLTGGIYVKGDASVTMSINAQDKAVYTIVQGGTTKVITVDSGANQTSVFNSSNNSTTTYTGQPKGTDGAGTIIYVDGNVSSFSGTVQKDTAVTLASHNSITINNNVKYSDYTPGSGTPGQAGYVAPSASGAENLLGIVSWTGDVHIGISAPDNVEVHGTIMAQNGILDVTNYNSGSPRGTATLLGGVITDDYGAFGQFNSSTGQQVSGYGRNFVYDQRMLQGAAPPYFPTLNTFTAFTNDLIDKLVWQESE